MVTRTWYDRPRLIVMLALIMGFSWGLAAGSLRGFSWGAALLGLAVALVCRGVGFLVRHVWRASAPGGRP